MSEKTADDYAATLQEIWPRYLDALDRYTSAQKEISKLYASATFSLARANFANTTGRRYGETQYDGRMTAATTANVSDAGVVSVASLFGKQPKESPAITREVTKSTEKSPEDESSSTTEASTSNTEEASSAPESIENYPSTTEIAKVAPKDPLRWFGVLTPRPLRQCQSDFLTLTTGPVANAVMAAAEMRQLEKEIRRLRKAKAKAAKIVR